MIEWFRIYARPLRETEKALLVELETGDELWVPQVLIGADSEVWKAGQGGGEFVIPEWFAEKEGVL